MKKLVLVALVLGSLNVMAKGDLHDQNNPTSAGSAGYVPNRVMGVPANNLAAARHAPLVERFVPSAAIAGKVYHVDGIGADGILTVNGVGYKFTKAGDVWNYQGVVPNRVMGTGGNVTNKFVPLSAQ